MASFESQVLLHVQDFVEKERAKKRKAHEDLQEFRATYNIKAAAKQRRPPRGDDDESEGPVLTEEQNMDEEEEFNGLEGSEGEDANAKKTLNLWRLRNEMYQSFFVTRRVRQWALW